MMITSEFDAVLVSTGGVRASLGLRIELSYDPVGSPFAIRMAITHPHIPDDSRVWLFSWELLEKAVLFPTPLWYGPGGVTFRTQDSRALDVRLRGIGGEARLQLPRFDVAAFIAMAKPVHQEAMNSESGRERRTAAIDEFLQEVFDGTQ